MKILTLLTEIRDLLKSHVPTKEIMGVEEAADFLNISSSYLWEMIGLYQVPFFRTPGNGTRGRVLLRKTDLEKWIEERTIKSEADERRLNDGRRLKAA